MCYGVEGVDVLRDDAREQAQVAELADSGVRDVGMAAVEIRPA